jgi:arginine/lysine/ornithine decarboxylase
MGLSGVREVGEEMDHSAAPLLEALADYHARDRYGFTPPGHRQGRGADPRTVAAIGRDAFRSDLLATAGLDDRSSSHGYLSRAEELMADAVGAEQAFFSTCGSSLSVKAAMLAVAGGKGSLLVSRDAHKSVVAGLVFGGIQPQWIRPRYDERLHLAHPPSIIDEAWGAHLPFHEDLPAWAMDAGAGPGRGRGAARPGDQRLRRRRLAPRAPARRHGPE